MAFSSLDFLSFSSVARGSVSSAMPVVRGVATCSIITFAATVFPQSGMALSLEFSLAQSSAPSSLPVVPAANPVEPPLSEPGAAPTEGSATGEDKPEGASSGDEVAEPLPEPTPLVSPDIPPLETANYSDEQMSIDYPATWQVEVGEEGMLSIQTPADASLLPVVTQVFRVATPPGPLVDANLDSFSEEGAAVRRYSGATIDGQDALVIWLADRPDELSHAIATFIGYGDETVFLFTRYAAEAIEAEASILRLHSSFSNLAAGAEVSPMPDSPMPDSDASASDDVPLM